ncbi:MAG TPA: macro domain-containing protein [Candidatus Paceibacterota bacterium]|nr:macro domain-containing protein [Candidatus Paceibacterota bacterium]
MIKIVLGDILYPKSDILVCPCNLSGTVTKGIPSIISGINGAGRNLVLQIRDIISKGKLKVGDCFWTEPYRMKRKKVKTICHTIIGETQDDCPSIHIVESCMKTVLQEVKEKGKSIAFPPLIERCLDKFSLAKRMVLSCENFYDKLDIKIISDDKEFVEYAKKCLKIETE